MKDTIEQAAIAFANECRIANIKACLDYPYDELDMRNAFEAGAEWQSKQSPWISVEERLPEKDGLRVWVRSSLFDEQPLVYWKGKFYARLPDGAYDGSVTYWMAIPE